MCNDLEALGLGLLVFWVGGLGSRVEDLGPGVGFRDRKRDDRY